MGTDSIPLRSAGVIDETHLNRIIDAICTDIVPRNTSGVATDQATGLGSATHSWKRAYIKSIVLGAVASGLKLSKSSTDDFQFDLNSLEMLRFGAQRIENQSSVSFANRPFGGVYFADQSGGKNQQISATTMTVVNGLTLTVKCSGRPMMFALVGDDDWETDEPYVQLKRFGPGTESSMNANVELYDSTNTTAVRESLLGMVQTLDDVELTVPPQAFRWVYTPSAGQTTFQIRARITSGPTTKRIEFNHCRFIAWELNGI